MSECPDCEGSGRIERAGTPGAYYRDGEKYDPPGVESCAQCEGPGTVDEHTPAEPRGGDLGAALAPPRAGLRFVHGYWLDGDCKPAQYEVTAVRKGWAFIRPVGRAGKAKEKVWIADRWPVVCKEIVT